MSDVLTYSNERIEAMHREIASLRTQLDQERQRRLHAEVLLRGIQAGLTYSEDLKESIDKHFGEWDE